MIYFQCLNYSTGLRTLRKYLFTYRLKYNFPPSKRRVNKHFSLIRGKGKVESSWLPPTSHTFTNRKMWENLPQNDVEICQRFPAGDKDTLYSLMKRMKKSLKLYRITIYLQENRGVKPQGTSNWVSFAEWWQYWKQCNCGGLTGSFFMQCSGRHELCCGGWVGEGGWLDNRQPHPS